MCSSRNAKWRFFEDATKKCLRWSEPIWRDGVTFTTQSKLYPPPQRLCCYCRSYKPRLNKMSVSSRAVVHLFIWNSVTCGLTAIIPKKKKSLSALHSFYCGWFPWWRVVLRLQLKLVHHFNSDVSHFFWNFTCPYQQNWIKKKKLPYKSNRDTFT